MKYTIFITGIIILFSCKSTQYMGEGDIEYVYAIDSNTIYEDTRDYTFSRAFDTIKIKVTTHFSKTGEPKNKYKIIDVSKRVLKKMK